MIEDIIRDLLDPQRSKFARNYQLGIYQIEDSGVSWVTSSVPIAGTAVASTKQHPRSNDEDYGNACSYTHGYQQNFATRVSKDSSPDEF